GITVGNAGDILRTTNAGSSWQQMTSSVTANLRSLSFINENTGWASGATGVVLKTTNGGVNWVTLVSGSSLIINDIYFANSTTGYSVCTSGVIAVSTNGGSGWTNQTSGTGNDLNGICFTDTAKAFVVGNSGTILYTSNKGANWTAQSSGFAGNLNKAAFLNNNTGYVVGTSGTILKTTNAGSVWTAQTSGVPTNILNNIFIINENNIWIAGASGVLLKTTNGGDNWVLQNSSTINDLYGIYFSDAYNGTIVGMAGAILHHSELVPPAAPVLISPLNNSTVLVLTPKLDWSSVSGGATYRIQVSRDSLFTNPSLMALDTSLIPADSLIVPPGKITGSNKFYWRVNCTNAAGTGPWSAVWNFTVLWSAITGNTSEIPNNYQLQQNYPNPFNPSTKIKFALPKDEFVSIKIYDMTGKEVMTLVNKQMQAGYYEYSLTIPKLSSGIYFYKMSAGDFSSIRKMVLLK
ncbi:MAG TPA: YCF48-related protein, partial [Ignavibacteria bacterium]|nr:YCF48-related protein [Ignavibacteria bacterium]